MRPWPSRRPRRARPGPARARQATMRDLVRPARGAIGATEFLGYDTETAEGVILALVKDGARSRRRSRAMKVRSSSTRRRSTPNPAVRWATQGTNRESGTATVTDTQKKAMGVFVHMAEVVEGDRSSPASRARAGGRSRAPRRRSAPTIRPRICCTRRCAKALGDHVAQKGSLNAPDRLRFDFSHPKPMRLRGTGEVETMANGSSARIARSRPG
jgi:alanyl-tRNA synthetase